LLVTGGGGFVLSHLARQWAALDAGNRVIVLDAAGLRANPCWRDGNEAGAGDRDRTDDIQLGKHKRYCQVALFYQAVTRVNLGAL
jgi:nucleoside-diphosphate-sugar epimerase